MIPKGNVERALVALVVANLALVSSQVHATTDLDSSFGNGGRVVTDVSGRYDEARALAIQADGRIVAAGVTGTGSNEGFALVRYKTDGALDRTFGVGGTVITDVSRGSDAVWAVAIQSDGKIVAAGVASGEFALARYNAMALSIRSSAMEEPSPLTSAETTKRMRWHFSEMDRLLWLVLRAAVTSRSLDTAPTARWTQRSELRERSPQTSRTTPTWRSRWLSSLMA